MKSKTDPRHLRRIKLFKKLFSTSFDNLKNPPVNLKLILKNLKAIDKYITDSAPDWPIAKLNKVDLAILRLAIFELKYESKNPPKVIIDEAIELAKAFGTEKTPKFVNGVLGTIVKQK